MLRFDSPGARSPAGPGSPFVDAGGDEKARARDERRRRGTRRRTARRTRTTGWERGIGERERERWGVDAGDATRGGSNGGGGGGGGGKLELSATTCDELARVLESRRYGREASSLQEAVKTIDLVEHVLKRNRENLREFFSACFQRFCVDCFRSMGPRARGG